MRKRQKYVIIIKKIFTKSYIECEVSMGFSYDKLWKKLIDNKMNKTDLQECVGITSRTIAKMGKDENVNMDTLGKLCEYFQCDISEILEYEPNKNNDGLVRR